MELKICMAESRTMPSVEVTVFPRQRFCSIWKTKDEVKNWVPPSRSVTFPHLTSPPTRVGSSSSSLFSIQDFLSEVPRSPKPMNIVPLSSLWQPAPLVTQHSTLRLDQGERAACSDPPLMQGNVSIVSLSPCVLEPGYFCHSVKVLAHWRNNIWFFSNFHNIKRGFVKAGNLMFCPVLIYMLFYKINWAGVLGTFSWGKKNPMNAIWENNDIQN